MLFRSKMATMADGIAVGRPGDIPFAMIQKYVDEVITVSEESLARTLLLTMERSKLIVEAAGIAALTAILDNPSHFEGPVVATLSGGNIDPQLLNRVIRSGLSAAGRFMTLQVRLPDRPGALAELLTVIGQAGANVVEVSHTRINPRLDIDRKSTRLNSSHT